MPKIIRITTVPISLNILLKGQLKYMQNNGFELIAASASGPEIKEFCKREEIPHKIINFTRTLSPIKDLKALYQLILLIRKERPEIVHTHTPKAGLLGMLAAKICGVPVRMHTIAGMPLMEVDGFLKYVLQFTESITYACAHFVYPNSLQLKKWVETHFESYKGKVKIIGDGSTNGISLEYFSSSEELIDNSIKLRNLMHIKEHQVSFIFVGRLVRDKGINELVKAFGLLDNEYHLILVGAYEDERDPIKAATKDLIDSNPRIHHVGFQSDVRPYLLAADIFVFPSYREGFPNVVLQASAMRLPSIVSDINGNNEIIEDRKNGWIVPVKNVNALSSAMQSLGENAELREKMAKQARAALIEKYEQHYVWDLLLREYETLLSGKS